MGVTSLIFCLLECKCRLPNLLHRRKDRDAATYKLGELFRKCFLQICVQMPT